MSGIYSSLDEDPQHRCHQAEQGRWCNPAGQRVQTRPCVSRLVHHQQLHIGRAAGRVVGQERYSSVADLQGPAAGFQSDVGDARPSVLVHHPHGQRPPGGVAVLWAVAVQADQLTRGSGGVAHLGSVKAVNTSRANPPQSEGVA